MGKIPLEEGIATDSRILAWSIPWTEEPGGLWSTGSQRVGHHGARTVARVADASNINISYRCTAQCSSFVKSDDPFTVTIKWFLYSL